MSNQFAALAVPAAPEESPVAPQEQDSDVQLAVPESTGEWQRSKADIKRFQSPEFLTAVQRVVCEITDMTLPTGYFNVDGSIQTVFDAAYIRIHGPKVPEKKFVGGKLVATGNFIIPFHQITYPTGSEVMPGTRFQKMEISQHPQVTGLLIGAFKQMFGPEVYVGVKITPERISVRLMKDKRFEKN